MTKIIAIEGPDRCGKATQSKLLLQRLVAAGYTAKIVEVPIHSNFAYSVVYWMLRNGLAKRFPKIFQWFQYFNRQIFQWRELPTLEQQCDYIIMDRWSLSTTVYGEATGVHKEFTTKLSRRLKQPFHTFVLLGKSHKHDAEDVYEADTALQSRVRKIYKEWVVQHPREGSEIDCNRERAVVSDEIWNTLRMVESVTASKQ